MILVTIDQIERFVPPDNDEQDSVVVSRGRGAREVRLPNMLEFAAMLNSAWLLRVTYLYMALPLILFFFGWLRPLFGLPLSLLVLWSLYHVWRDAGDLQGGTSHRLLAAVVLVSGAWVLLSGIGGYAFQNWDHHWRNAVFHDLISYDWPVVYSAPEKGPIRMLVYYVGFWLPAALTGKYLGWQAANAALFLWSWLGVILVGLHLTRRVASWRAILLLVFFGGLDALGVLLFPGGGYPRLWPPISHLETWPGALQYSSFTTQLFWVFNQAIPAWLCALALLAPGGRKHGPLVWSLCFFQAPLAAIGWLPLLLIEVSSGVMVDGRLEVRAVHGLVSRSTIAAAVIAGATAAYFLSNQTGQQVALRGLEPGQWLLFVLLEGGILWLALYRSHRGDPRWYAVGALLFAIPLMQLGNGRDFVMRASIPALLYLMLWCGEAVFPESGTPGALARGWPRTLIVLALAIGSLAPLYEINRSVFRTAEYYLLPASRATGPEIPVEHLAPEVTPEEEHPGRLAADSLHSLAGVRDELSRNFVANVRGSFFDNQLSGR